jgi:GntR family transcriptional repressor for pyruvate dehydrogenase complex
MLKPIGKQRVAEEIVHQLRGLILRGHYATGDKLPPERKLAEELGVNRASLREAIKALEQMGLVKTRQGDGTRVLDFMQTAGVELVSHLVAGGNGVPSIDVLDDVLEFRRIFAREVARLAAKKASQEDFERLEELAQRADDPSLSHEDLLRVDFEFYIELTRAARNRVFQLLINTIRAAVLSHAPFFTQISQAPQAIRKHHRDVIRALRAREPDKVAALVDEYLSKGQELLSSLFPPMQQASASSGAGGGSA